MIMRILWGDMQSSALLWLFASVVNCENSAEHECISRYWLLFLDASASQPILRSVRKLQSSIPKIIHWFYIRFYYFRYKYFEIDTSDILLIIRSISVLNFPITHLIPTFGLVSAQSLWCCLWYLHWSIKKAQWWWNIAGQSQCWGGRRSPIK